jgi:hypothetical protein
VAEPKEKKPPIKTRTPGRIGGMFDRVKLRPETHPIEEIIHGPQPPPESEPLPVSEPVIKSEPSAEIDTRTPVALPQPPLQTEPVIKSEPVTISEGVSILPDDAPHLRMPYQVFDVILPRLKPAPRVLLERLYRLSAGWHSDTCTVSIGKLASQCKIGETQVRQYLHELESAGYIKRVRNETGGKDLDARGIMFKVLLPRMTPPRKRTGSEKARGSESEPNKLKDLKKDIKGESASLDHKKCPDCNGMGVKYIDQLDYSKGTVKCHHERSTA